MTHVRPDRVAIYVRWSTDDQGEGTTLDVQLEGCRHYALSQGWQTSDALTFIDDGYSGGNLMRPALTRLRERIKAGEVDCVVVFKVDRLSRNIVDAVELVLNEWQERCFFKSAREPIDTSSDLGRVIFGILAMFADFERTQIKERTQSGKVRRIAEGKQLHGEPAFGYQPGTARGQWREQPAEAALVRRIFELAAGGASASAICRRLNGEGLRTRAGKPWSIRSLLWLLRNRLYIGEAIYGRTRLKLEQGRRTRRVTRPEPTVQTITQAAPALIDTALFEKAQLQLARNGQARRTAGPRAMSSPHLLVGLARCRCGGSLVAKRQRGDSFSYICHSTRTGRCEHAPGYVPGPAADAAVLALFAALHGPKAITPDRLARLVAQGDTTRQTLAAQRAAAQRAITGLQDQEARILRQARSGDLDPRDLRDLRQSISQERDDLTDRLHRLSAELNRIKHQRTTETPLDPSTLLQLPRKQQRDLLRGALSAPLILYKAKGSQTIEIEATWAAPGTHPLPGGYDEPKTGEGTTSCVTSERSPSGLR